MASTLYERLGGAAGIARIVDDVIDAHLNNPIVGPRFAAIEDLDHTRQMAREFFCAGTGGPETYTGKDLSVAHKGMNISEQEYLEVMDDIVGVLEKHEIDEATRNEVVAVLYSLKGEVIRL